MSAPRIALVALVTATACASSTPRPLPDDVVPAGWETRTATGAAAATGTTTTADWWRDFDDPILTELIEASARRNLDVRIAEARIQEARATLSGAAAELWPALSADAGVSYGRDRSGERGARFTLGLGASWEVDVFGRLRNEERAATADAVAYEADRSAVQLLLEAEVAEVYVEYRLRRVQLALALETTEAQEQTVRITRARFEQGIASRFDLERALAALALTRSRTPEAEELALAAQHRLALLLADAPTSIARALSGDRPLPESDPLRVFETPAEVIARRPDVRAAEWRLRASLARKDAAEALRYPRLDLAGMIGLDSSDLGRLFDPVSAVWSLGAGLVAPLIDFGRIRAQIDVADARQEQAYLQYERAVRTALQEAQTAIMSYAHGVIRQRELENALTSAQRAARFARLQYREGTVSLLEVLEAERSLDDAELSWSQATAEVSLRMIRVHRTMGG